MFCPKCENLLIGKRKGGKSVLSCSCGYSSKGEEAIIKEENKDINKIEVVDKKIETLPKTEQECKECGNGEAYYWLVQTRAGDEAETRFFKCSKCEHTWREYS